MWPLWVSFFMYKVEIVIISISRILANEVSSTPLDTLCVFSKRTVTVNHYYEKQAVWVSLPQPSQNPAIVISALPLHLAEPLNTWLVLPASENFTTGMQIHGYGTPLRQFLRNDEVVQRPGLGQVLTYPLLIWLSAWIAGKHDLLSCIMKSQAQEACHPSLRGSQQLPALLPRWRDLEDYHPPLLNQFPMLESVTDNEFLIFLSYKYFAYE